MKLQALVLDPGTANLRSGLATASAQVPKITSLGLTKNACIRKGVLLDTGIFEQHVVAALQTAGTNPVETNILTSLSLLGSKQTRERCAEILLESVGVSGVAFCRGNLHALTSTGRYSGVLIDIGEAGTDITVVVNGEISSQSNSISRAGHLISTALFASLQSAIPDLEYLSAVKLKERSAFVSQNLQEDVSSPLCIQKGRFDLLMKSFDQRANTSLVSQLPRELWPEICYFASCFATSHKFTTLGPQLCRCVEAAFFENKLAPEVMLLPDAIHSAMRGHPPSTLEILSRNIVLTGGTSLLPGIVERLQSELAKRPNPFPIRISRARDSALSLNWYGAAQLAKRADFESALVTTRAEYYDEGTLSLYRKLA